MVVRTVTMRNLAAEFRHGRKSRCGRTGIGQHESLSRGFVENIIWWICCADMLYPLLRFLMCKLQRKASLVHQKMCKSHPCFIPLTLFHGGMIGWRQKIKITWLLLVSEIVYHGNTPPTPQWQQELSSNINTSGGRFGWSTGVLGSINPKNLLF